MQQVALLHLKKMPQVSTDRFISEHGASVSRSYEVGSEEKQSHLCSQGSMLGPLAKGEVTLTEELEG